MHKLFLLCKDSYKYNNHNHQSYVSVSNYNKYLMNTE